MALNRTQIISLVLGRLGKRGGDTFLLAQAELELGLIQSRLESGAFLPWFLLSGEVTFATTTASQRFVPHSADFIREWDDYKLTRYDATATDDPYTELLKDDRDYLLTEYAEESSAAPLAYALSGSQFDLFPLPDAAYPLLLNYYQKAAVLSDSVLTNVWTENADDLLIAELGLVMARYTQNKEAQATFADDLKIAHNRIIAQDIARSQANRDARRGDIHG